MWIYNVYTGTVLYAMSVLKEEVLRDIMTKDVRCVMQDPNATEGRKEVAVRFATTRLSMTI